MRVVMIFTLGNSGILTFILMIWGIVTFNSGILDILIFIVETS